MWLGADHSTTPIGHVVPGSNDKLSTLPCPGAPPSPVWAPSKVQQERSTWLPRGRADGTLTDRLGLLTGSVRSYRCHRGTKGSNQLN